MIISSLGIPKVLRKVTMAKRPAWGMFSPFPAMAMSLFMHGGKLVDADLPEIVGSHALSHLLRLDIDLGQLFHYRIEYGIAHR